MKKSFAVFGLGRLGSVVVEELAVAGADVLAVDRAEERVRRVADIATAAICADICAGDALEQMGLNNMDGVIVSMTGSLEASIMAIMAAKKEGVPVIWARAMNETQREIFRRLGADHIFSPEKEQGISVARSMLSGSFLDFVELSEKISMIKMPARPEWVGHSLAELDLRRKYNLNVIALAEGNVVRQNVDPSAKLPKGATLFVITDEKGVKKLQK